MSSKIVCRIVGGCGIILSIILFFGCNATLNNDMNMLSFLFCMFPIIISLPMWFIE
mgnify:CR=1 FL=1